jgi:hypothetical protein
LLLLLGVAGALILGGQPVFAADAGQPELRAGSIVHGSLALAADRQSVILSAAAISPGQHVAGSTGLANTGSLAGRLSLSAATEGSPLLRAALRLLVARVASGRELLVYSGSLAGLDDAPAGALEAGSTATFRFRLTLPAGAGNELQGLSSTTTFTWTAVAAR